MENKRYLIRTIVTIGIMAAFLAAIYLFIGRPMIAFVGDREAFENYIAEAGIRGILVFGMFVFFQTLSTCIPGLPFYLAAGAAIGGVKGALLCDAFATLANTLAFVLGRHFGRNFLCFLFPEDKLKKVEDLILDKNPVLVHVLFMLLPLPKDTYAWLGYYSKEGIIPWIIITFLARFPHIFIYTFGAEKVLENQYGYIIGGAVFAVIIYLVIMVRFKKKNNKKSG